MRIRVSSLVAGVAAVLAVVVLCWLLVVASGHVDFGFGRGNGHDVGRVVYAIIVFSAVGFTLGFALMVAIAVEDARADGGRVSALYWPMISFVGWLLVLLLLSSASALYVLNHDFRHAWAPVGTPLVRLASALIYGGVFGSVLWLFGVLLSGRGLALWKLGAVFVAICVVVTALLFAAVTL